MKINKDYYDSLVRDSERIRIIESMVETDTYIDNKTLRIILGMNTENQKDFDFDLPFTIPEPKKPESMGQSEPKLQSGQGVV